MIDYESSNESLLAFYGATTLSPHSLRDICLADIPSIDDSLALPRSQQYELLASLMLNDDGVDTLAPFGSDAEDPLRGPGLSIVLVLQDSGVVSSSHDPAVADYLITSNKFNPRKYLRAIHHDLPIEELELSLMALGEAIGHDLNNLKGVLDDNFAKLIKCKTAIDDTLLGIKNERSQAQKDAESSRVFDPRQSSLKLDNLYTELEQSVNDLNVMSALKIRPITQTKDREAKIARLMEIVRSNLFLFDLPRNLDAFLRKREHEQFIDNYHRFLNEKQAFLHSRKERIRAEGTKLLLSKDEQGLKLLKQDMALEYSALSRAFDQVESIAGRYRRKTFKELLSLDQHVALPKRGTLGLLETLDGTSRKFMALIKKLYELRSNDDKEAQNPITDFMVELLRDLDKELDYQIDKFQARFAMMQRKLGDYISTLEDAPPGVSHVSYIADKFTVIEEYHAAYSLTLNYSAQERHDISIEVFDSAENLDSSIVSETWLVLLNFADYFVGLFTAHLNKFVANYRHFIEHDIDSNGNLQASFISIVEKVCNAISTCFSSTVAAKNQLESSPANFALFLPLLANSLSTVYYLRQCELKIRDLFTAMGELVGTMGQIRVSAKTNSTIKLLRTTSTLVNQAILEAICVVWINDCTQLYALEDWLTISEDSAMLAPRISDANGAANNAVHTKFIYIVQVYEDFMITKLANLLFEDKSEKTKSEFRIVAAHPSKRVLVSIEIQFMRSLKIIIDAVMKRYSIERTESPHDSEGLYKVLTMNNVDMLSQVLFPGLIRRFDTLFLQDLQNQNLSFLEDIETARRAIYEDIVAKEKSWILEKISSHFNSDLSRRSSSIQVDAVMYDVLTHLVKLLHAVRPLTGSNTLISLMNELQLGTVRDALLNIRQCTDLTPVELLNWRLNLNFFTAVFETSKTLQLNPETVTMLGLLLDTIQERIGPQMGIDDPKREVAMALSKSLSDSRYQFSCFQ